MLQSRHKVQDHDISLAQRRNFNMLLRLLGEKGWEILSVAEAWRHHESDVMVVPPWLPRYPIWIYVSRSGAIIVKSWKGEFRARQLLHALPPGYTGALKLRVDRRMFARGHRAEGWGQFLTESSRRQAEQRGLLPQENRAEL